jgi:predicted glycosyltransferase
MKKILFYCQYLAGMGHLVRSREIIRSLVQDFQVCLVIGGEPILGFTLPKAAEVVYLPALREEAGALLSADPCLEDVKARRIEKLLGVFEQFQPDCVVTECFPFSKYKMSFELVPLLEQAQAAQVKVVCSLRDLIMTQAMSEPGLARKEARIHEQIRRYYDWVLVHCDRTVQSLETCFPTAAQLECDVFYTGYVAQTLQPSPSVPPLTLDQGIPNIVASVGGGRDGYPLLQAVIAASALLQQRIPHRIYAFAGPFMPEAEFNDLQALASSQPHVMLQRFTLDLTCYLAQADLSISLGGYNTTMNVLRTGIRSLIMPSPSADQADEQRQRASLLAQRGIVDLLEPEDLKPERFAQTLLKRLAQPRPIHAINLNGADNTRLQLRSLLHDALVEPQVVTVY